MASRLAISIPQEERLLRHLVTLPRRNQLMIILQLRTGFRISELLSLDVGQVTCGDRIRDEVTIERFYLKGGAGTRRRTVRSRTVPLSATVREALLGYLVERFDGRSFAPEEPLFISRNGRRRLGAWQALAVVKQAIIAATGESSGRWGTHSLRKKFVTDCYQRSGFDLLLTRAAVGHVRSESTERYIAIDSEKARLLIASL